MSIFMVTPHHILIYGCSVVFALFIYPLIKEPNCHLKLSNMCFWVRVMITKGSVVMIRQLVTFVSLKMCSLLSIFPFIDLEIIPILYKFPTFHIFQIHHLYFLHHWSLIIPPYEILHLHHLLPKSMFIGKRLSLILLLAPITTHPQILPKPLQVTLMQNNLYCVVLLVLSQLTDLVFLY